MIILSNIFQKSQQHCCATAAGMLQFSKVVAPTSYQVLIQNRVSLHFEYQQIVFRRLEFLCMFCIKHRTLQRCYKICSKACATRQDFSFGSSYSFCSNVTRCIGDGNNIQLLYKINRGYNVQNPIKFEEAFNQVTQRSQVEGNTDCNPISIFRNLRTTIFQTKNKKLLSQYSVFFVN